MITIRVVRLENKVYIGVTMGDRYNLSVIKDTQDVDINRDGLKETRAEARLLGLKIHIMPKGTPIESLRNSRENEAFGVSSSMDTLVLPHIACG